MKIKQGFMLREVAGNFVVVAVGEASKNFNGVINLNESGAFLWKQLMSETTNDKLLDALLNEYSGDVNKEGLLKSAINGMVAQLNDPYSGYMEVEDAADVFTALKQQGIAIRLMKNYLRICAGSDAENKAVLEALEAALKGA